MTRPSPPANEVHQQRIPVLVAGGFLGSGKTTLVNHILRNANGRRIVVFVNDFGEINIDADLIVSIEEDRVALSNGCVCCTLNDELVQSMADYATQGDKPDAFLIETSGVSDPRQLQGSLDALEASGLARLDGLLYVIDADLFFTLEHEQREQIIDHACGADLLLLNKQDVTSSEDMERLHALFEESAPYSTRLNSTRCEIDMNLVFGPNNLDESLASSWSGTPDTGAASGKIDSHEHLSFSSCTLSHPDPVSRSEFKTFCDNLPQHCIRAKGFVRFDEPDPEADATVYAFSQIGVRASLEQAPHQAIAGLRLVLIGETRTFDHSSIKSLFSAMVAASPTP